MTDATSAAPRSLPFRLRSRWALTALVLAPLVTSVAWLAAPPASAGDACDELRGDEGILPGEILPHLGGGWRTAELPEKGDAPDTLTELEIEGAAPIRPMDLDLDGRPELFLTTQEGRQCGSGGCPYQLLAPGTFRRIGRFFGQLAVLDERVNGYRIIQSYSRYRVALTSLDTYVFDGEAYRLVAHALIDECGLRQWHRRLRVPGK